MLLRMLATIAMALAIPVVAMVAANLILTDIYAATPPSDLCVPWEPPSTLCARAFWTTAMREIGLLSGAVFLGVIIVYVALARIAGASRARNAAIFPRLAPAATFAVGALALVQGGVLTGVVYLYTEHFIGPWGAPLAALVGVVAFASGLAALWTLFRANAEQPAGVLARLVTAEAAPELWAFVDAVAAETGAERPRNLLVGLDPTFFATAAPIRAPGLSRPLRGETLYLSLPLMRLFTADELQAVVAHELAHFSGEDTAFSKRFAPVYRNLAEAIISFEGDGGWLRWLITLPARLTLDLMYQVFALNERRISRKRELEADKAAIAAAGPEALATSLAKVAVYAPLWLLIRKQNAERLTHGRLTRNLSRIYAASARYDVSHSRIGEILTEVMATRIAHPTDSHPRVAERYAAIGFEPQRLTIEALTRQGASGAPLFPNLEAVEEDLTMVEHRALVEAGLATPPEGPVEQNDVLHAAYVLAAAMVAAEGGVATREIHVAEGVGRQMFEDFDSVSFRETVDRRDELPDFLNVVELLKPVLTPEQRGVMQAYLAEIAAIDGGIGPQEKSLLDKAARIWGLKGLRRLLKRE